jgi:CspA family cold shock protein
VILVANGTVKTFNRSSGHGFILPDEGGTDLWVHERNVMGDAPLREGDRVEFSAREAGMGAEAVNVHPIVPSPSGTNDPAEQPR